MARLALSIALMLFALGGAAARGQPSDFNPETAASPPVVSAEEITPLLVQAIAPLRPALLSDRHVELNYELELRVALSTPLTIEKLEVLDPVSDNEFVAEWTAEELKGLIRLPGHSTPTLALSPGDSGYLRVNLVFTRLSDVPRYLVHRFTLAATFPPATEPTTRELDLANCSVDLHPLPVIAPPLRGDRWVAAVVGGEGYHRSMIMPINGRWVAPERWAVD